MADRDSRTGAMRGTKSGAEREVDRRVIKVEKNTTSDWKPKPKFPLNEAREAELGREIGHLAEKLAQLKREGKDKEFAEAKEQLERLGLQIKDQAQVQIRQQIEQELAQKLATVKSKDGLA